MARPAAAVATLEAQALVEAVHDDDSEEEAVPAEDTVPCLQLINGRNNSMTIAVVGATSKDRAQILQVTSSQCIGDFTPKTACEAIQSKLNVEMKGLTLPVKDAPWLDPLRKHAQQLRQNTLS